MPQALLRLTLAASLLLAPGCIATTIEHSSPLRARNQHPAQLTAIHADARPARAPEAGKVEGDVRLDWTSHWLLNGRGRDEIHWDGETLRTRFDFRVGLGRDMDVEVGVPLMHAGGGTLDGFIEGWHDLWGMPQNGRDTNPRDQFRMEAIRELPDGSRSAAYRMDRGGFRLGDIPLFLTWFPYRQDGLSLGVRGGIEFPTGSEKDGYGNGGFDANLGFLGGYDAPGYSLFFWGSHSFVATADRARSVGLHYPDIDTFGVGGELALSPNLAALVQFEFESSVLRVMDETHADSNQLLIWAGGRYRLSEDVDFEFAVAEELILDVSPDVTFHFGLNYRF